MKIFYRKINVTFIFAIFFCACVQNPHERKYFSSHIPVEKSDSASIDTIPQQDSLLHIVAVGDMMLGSPYPASQKLPAFDGEKSFSKVKKFLKGDIVFGNLEGCLLDTGNSKKCIDTSKACYAFRMPERYIKHFKNAGFTLLSVANNHINDFGFAGRQKTQQLLKAHQIHFAGLVSAPYQIFRVNGQKIAFCAFSSNAYTLNINNIPAAVKLVKKLKLQADKVLVSFHGGAEGLTMQHVPRSEELFYKEKRGNVYAFAHALIDAGADVVLGHGPHVSRAFELYKNKFIAYSLGNFCTYGQFNLSKENGIAPILNLYLNKNGDFEMGNVISTQQSPAHGLRLDTLQRSFYTIKALSHTDFPESTLRFENGKLFKK